jgi:hypothetical protein
VLRGCTVESLTHHAERNDGGIWRAKALAAATQLPAIIDSRDAFLATGKHDLRGWPRPAKGSQHTLVAIKMYFLLSPRQWEELAGHVELIVYPGGYAGLQPVENGYTNFCALVTREKLRMLDKRWDYLLGHIKQHCPHLARRLDGAASLLDRPLTLSAIPYGYCAETSFREPAPWRLGDQAAVIPSFCGDGMAIALYTAHRAAQLYLDGLSPAVFHEEVRRRLQRRL